MLLKRNTYVLQYNGIKKRNADITELSKIIVTEIQDKNQKKILKNNPFISITYKHKHICIYNTAEDPLFDIMHIIKLLGVTDMNKKYGQFKDCITHYGFKKNEFGGYIMKEFISEKSMYQLVLSSNSKLSKQFKADVSEILADLRKSSSLIISDNKLILKDRDVKRQNMRNDEINDQLDIISNHRNNKISYDNPYYLEMIKILVKKRINDNYTIIFRTTCLILFGSRYV